MKKVFTLLTLALLSIGSAWADTEVSPVGGSSNAEVIGTSFTIDGTFNAGSGTQLANMQTKGIKIRTNRAENTLKIAVNDGYTINSVDIYIASNDKPSKLSVTGITVDGTAYTPGGVTYPLEVAAKDASNDATVIAVATPAKDNITLSFGGTSNGTGTQGIMELHVDYTQEKVIVQEITAVTFNGTAISDKDLATLKSTKALTIDGSALNGVGMVDVTLSSGGTTVTKVIDGTTATYTFTINGTDAYTVTVNNLAGTYTEQGAVVYYKKNDTEADGTNSKTVTANGITFTMDADKTFQYGSGSVTMGENKYVPLKLSTGCGVNVTFPEGKVATKAIVYGWSASGNGQLTAFKESNDAEAKSVDVSGDVFYATNQATDTYPSVYEYNLDNWESLYFTAGGSASQPFVVIDFVLADKASETVTATIKSECGYATFCSDKALDFSAVEGLTAYIVTSTEFVAQLKKVTKVPAGTGLVLEGDEEATYPKDYKIPVIATADAIEGNLLKAAMTVTTAVEGDYVLAYKSNVRAFFPAEEDLQIPAGKAYLHIGSGEDAPAILPFDAETTGISATLKNSEKANKEIFNLAGQRVSQPTKGLYIVGGRKVVVK